MSAFNFAVVCIREKWDSYMLGFLKYDILYADDLSYFQVQVLQPCDDFR